MRSEVNFMYRIHRQKCPDNAYDNKANNCYKQMIEENYEESTKTAGGRTGQADGRGT